MLFRGKQAELCGIYEILRMRGRRSGYSMVLVADIPPISGGTGAQMDMNAGAQEWSTVGSEFRERRLRLKMTQEEVAVEADLNRDTVSAIEAGKGGLKSRRQLDDALTRLEDEGGLPPLTVAESDEIPRSAPTEPETSRTPVPMIRFTVEGVYGAKALVVEGPVENLPELEEAVDRIMRRLAGEQGSTPE